MYFTKMQACGNDFIVINSTVSTIELSAQAVEKFCDRHFGIGADGVILICPSQIADARMRIINADGGEVSMCGNGVRCAAKYIHDSGICRSSELKVETGAGVLDIRLHIGPDGNADAAVVDMGIPDTDPAHYPSLAADHIVTIPYNDKELTFFCVNTGVPHAVTFDVFPSDKEFFELGKKIEHDPLFPERTNVCFGRVDSRNKISAHIWERGCGATLACGTGSCAMLFAGYALGLTEREADIVLPGGTLRDRYAESGHIFMTGPAKTVFTGEITL